MIRISQTEDKKPSRVNAVALDDEPASGDDQNVPSGHQFALSDSFYASQLVTEDGQSDADLDTGSRSRGVLLELNSVLRASQSGHGGAIKRACDDGDLETDDDLVALTASSSSSLVCERRSPAKKPKFVVTYREMREFFALLNEESIQQFLKRDACCLISDKYALAMVFTYFKRAKFCLNEYTRTNFYLALYLASDIEEDVDDYKYEIFPWALGRRWRAKFTGFLRKRDALLRRIGYRAIVSRKCCDEVMSLVPDHSAWKRERSEDHGGATRAYLINRGKRYLSIKANMGYEELNFPRGPHEKPRPCLLCMLNRGCQSIAAAFNPAAAPCEECSDPACRACPLSLSSSSSSASEDATSSDSACQVSAADLTSVSSDKKKADESQDDEGIQSSSSVEAKPAAGSDSGDKYVTDYLANATCPKAPVASVACAKSASATHLHGAAAHTESRMPKISNHSLNKLKPDTCSNLPASNKFCQLKQSVSDLENTSFGAVSVHDSFLDESCCCYYYEAARAPPHVNALPPLAQRSTAAVKTTTTTTTTITKTKAVHAAGPFKYPSTPSAGCYLLEQDVITDDEDIIDDHEYYCHGRHHLGATDGDYESDEVFASNDTTSTTTTTTVVKQSFETKSKDVLQKRRLNNSYSSNTLHSGQVKPLLPIKAPSKPPATALDQQVPAPAKC